MNSDIKEYDENLFMISNIPLYYIVDNKFGHNWYNYITRDVLSDVTEENPTHLIQIQVTMNKRGQVGERVYTPDTTHMIISIGYTSIKKVQNYCILIYNQNFLVIYMVFPNNNYNIMNSHRKCTFIVKRGGGGKSSKTNPEPLIYQCDKFQYIDTLSLNPVDVFNPNLICYIPDRKYNNNHKYDRVK